MPQYVENCVRKLLDDKDFKPMEGKTREESAYAICYTNYQKHKKVVEGLKGKSD